MSRPSIRRRSAALVGVAALIGAASLHSTSAGASTAVEVVTTSFTAHNGEVFTATNHLVQDSEQIVAAKRALVKSALDGTNPQARQIVTAQGKIRYEYLVVWAGDANGGDNSGESLQESQVSVNPVTLPNTARDNAVGPDFLAVIDVTRGSPTYGRVVNTATTGPVMGNEPHHMQYRWHKGDSIYTGSLFSDITYVFDVKSLPMIKITGVNLPTDTPCGSVPDAYATLHDGTAYGTYMGGADVPGPCHYTNGEVRISNGFGGSPGSLVHVGPQGQTLSEVPAALPRAEANCHSYPELPQPTCANPHGINVREDLNRLITADYAEPRNVLTDPLAPIDPLIFRDTVRIWDISQRDNARIVSVSHMPDGPRNPLDPMHNEPRGMMEVGVTHLPQHKGAFASSSCGGVIYYTPDVTAARPTWREVWDITASAHAKNPQLTGGGCSGASWVQASLDDKYLFHIVIGRGPGSPLYGNEPNKKFYALDIRKLLAAGTNTTCSIDTVEEVLHGGTEPDCPTVTDTHQVADNTSGGPHWGAMDNFAIGSDGYYHETTDVTRIAFSDSFVARSGVDGDHRMCILNFNHGKFSLDDTFIDQNEGTPCVSFNRTQWPHGDYGDAKPHAMVFAVADSDVE
jgi:hypothetical protein